MKTYIAKIGTSGHFETKEIEINDFVGKIKKRANGRPHFRQVLTHQIPLFEDFVMRVKGYCVFYIPEQQFNKINKRLDYLQNREKRIEQARQYYQNNKPTAFQNLLRTTNFLKENQKQK